MTIYTPTATPLTAAAANPPAKQTLYRNNMQLQMVQQSEGIETPSEAGSLAGAVDIYPLRNAGHTHHHAHKPLRLQHTYSHTLRVMLRSDQSAAVKGTNHGVRQVVRSEAHSTTQHESRLVKAVCAS